MLRFMDRDQSQKNRQAGSAAGLNHMVTGVSGRLGSAVLQAILEHDLISPLNLFISTSSDPNDKKWQQVKTRGVVVRHANYDDVPGMIKAFKGIHKLLLISSPLLELDIPYKEYGEGRDRQHINVILACRAAGVRHIYYTSLGLAPINPFGSIASTMLAHHRTEHTLRLLVDISYTIIREAPYAELWPLYLGFYDGPSDKRRDLLIAGDGPVSWTSIQDLGLGTALILADMSTSWSGVTTTLSSQFAVPLHHIAEIVTRLCGNETRLSIVSQEQYIQYYTHEQGIDENISRWWVSTYAALTRHEGWHADAPLLSRLLEKFGRKPKHIDEVVQEMLSARKQNEGNGGPLVAEW